MPLRLCLTSLSRSLLRPAGAQGGAAARAERPDEEPVQRCFRQKGLSCAGQGPGQLWGHGDCGPVAGWSVGMGPAGCQPSKRAWSELRCSSIPAQTQRALQKLFLTTSRYRVASSVCPAFLASSAPYCVLCHLCFSRRPYAHAVAALRELAAEASARPPYTSTSLPGLAPCMCPSLLRGPLSCNLIMCNRTHVDTQE